MWLIYISTFVISLASLLVASGMFLVCWVIYQSSIRKGTAQPISVLPGKKPVTVDDIPGSLRKWIDQESESWARQELEQRALSRYDEIEDWPVVEMEIRNTITESSDG